MVQAVVPSAPTQHVPAPITYSTTSQVSGGSRNKIQDVNRQVDDVSAIMRENIDSLLSRNDKLDYLEEKSASLMVNSAQFKAAARKQSNSSSLLSSIVSSGTKLKKADEKKKKEKAKDKDQESKNIILIFFL
jgi:hypothetical protein